MTCRGPHCQNPVCPECDEPLRWVGPEVRCGCPPVETEPRRTG